MAYIYFSVEKGLVRDQWPIGLGRLSIDPQPNEFHLLVPSTFDGICEWAFVKIDPRGRDAARRFLYLHNSSSGYIHPSQNLLEVSARFQGFLGDFNVNTLWNWKGDSSRAYKASQFIRLEGGARPDLMQAQFKVYSNMRATILRTLLSNADVENAAQSTKMSEEGMIFERRVFTKVHDAAVGPSVLHPSDDPTGLTANLGNDWRITSKIAFGRRISGGVVERCNANNFSKGDLVDITARVEIVSIHTSGGVPSFEVRLSPTHLIRLCQAKDCSHYFDMRGGGPAKTSSTPAPVIENHELIFEEPTYSDQ
ncbi:hypothetical protein FA95DRAFT_1613760 [Auriscalpium vulgare]|uniref:Uncharacterized protein n=1 Tax=Auriscalpium vulgare TaxID=40419 RepID=A0ACB8R1G7_9AGAM|nr:hypothetical protein FA95DRAFT_1613760 [Auriscalpium vulgare]